MSENIFFDAGLLDSFIDIDETDTNIVVNPLCIPLSGSKIGFSKNKILKEAYGKIYVLCLSDDCNDTSCFQNIFKNDTDLAVLISTHIKSLKLVEFPTHFMNIPSVRKRLCVVKRDILQDLLNEDTSNEILVYVMIETCCSDVNRMAKMFKNNNKFEKFIKLRILTGYHNINHGQVDDYMLDLSKRIVDIKYWQNKNNCNISIFKDIEMRKFTLSEKNWNIDQDMVKDNMNKLFNMINEKKISTTGYPKKMTHNSSLPINSKSDKIIKCVEYKNDIKIMTSNSKTKKYPSKINYYVTNTNLLNIEPEIFIELMTTNSISNKIKYYIMCAFLSSKDYCHYVLNSKILECCSHIIKKYEYVFRYVFSYAWLSLYLEEYKKGIFSRTTDRFVVELSCAALLPDFKYNEPFQSPYLVRISGLDMKNNINSIKDTYQKGIIDVPTFEKRLNIFCTGNAKINIFENADWQNMVVTGGCMAAILPKYNPLFDIFDATTEDDKFNSYCREYYAHSDIDVACNHNNAIDFMNHIDNLKNLIHKNLSSFCNKPEVEIVSRKTVALHINLSVLKKKCISGEINMDYDFLINNKFNNDVKQLFYEYYIENKLKANRETRKNNSTKTNNISIMSFCPINDTTLVFNNIVTLNNFENRNPKNNSGHSLDFYLYHDDDIFIKFSETLKYRIESPQLLHPIECFLIGSNDFMSCISKFHLPCVRSYYNGKTCYLLPSAITAYKTFVNININYFVGSRDPITIINKYRQRGYSTLLNEFEVKQFVSFIVTQPVMCKLYEVKYGDIEKSMTNKILNYIGIGCKLFYPRKYAPELFFDNFTSSYCKNIKKNMPSITINYKPIYKKDGNIIPYLSWICEAKNNTMH